MTICIQETRINETLVNKANRHCVHLRKPARSKKPNRTNLRRCLTRICFGESPSGWSFLLSGLSRAGLGRSVSATAPRVLLAFARRCHAVSALEHWSARDVLVQSRVGCYGLWRTLGAARRCLEKAASAGRWWSSPASIRTAFTPSRGVSIPAKLCRAPGATLFYASSTNNKHVTIQAEKVLLVDPWTFRHLRDVDQFWPRSGFMSQEGQVCFVCYIFKYFVVFLLCQSRTSLFGFPC